MGAPARKHNVIPMHTETNDADDDDDDDESARFFSDDDEEEEDGKRVWKGREEEKYAHIDFFRSRSSPLSVILEIHPFDVLHSFDRRPSGGNGNGSKRRRNYAQLKVPGIDDDDDDREEET